jgi:hypothetical protein
MEAPVLRSVLAGCALAALTTVSATAQTPAALASAKPATAAAPATDPFEQAMAARSVADYGRRQKDPYALLTAARMLQEVPFQDAAPAEPGSPPPPFSAEALFDEAKALAKDDQALLMQIAIARQAGSRGVIASQFGQGLVRTVQALAARGNYAFPIKAKGGALLRVGAIGDTRTRMSMRLRDSRGRIVCDDSGDYAPVCSIQTQAAGDYRVELLNQTDSPTRAVILSN